MPNACTPILTRVPSLCCIYTDQSGAAEGDGGFAPTIAGALGNWREIRPGNPSYAQHAGCVDGDRICLHDNYGVPLEFGVHTGEHGSYLEGTFVATADGPLLVRMTANCEVTAITGLQDGCEYNEMGSGHVTGAVFTCGQGQGGEVLRHEQLFCTSRLRLTVTANAYTDEQSGATVAGSAQRTDTVTINRNQVEMRVAALHAAMSPTERLQHSLLTPPTLEEMMVAGTPAASLLARAFTVAQAPHVVFPTTFEAVGLDSGAPAPTPTNDGVRVPPPPPPPPPPAPPPPSQAGCVDDPNGWLAAAGASCQQLLPLGCATDLHDVDPANSPVGHFINSPDFCPASCGTCTTGDGGAASATCDDDPNGWLAAAGASCQQLMPLGCTTDLHDVDPAHNPVGHFINSPDFCPASCGTCPVAVTCDDDPDGWVAAAGASCQQLMPLGCTTDLHDIDPANNPVGHFINSPDFCPASCGTCTTQAGGGGGGGGGHRRTQREGDGSSLHVTIVTHAPTPGEAQEAIDRLVSNVGGTAGLPGVPAKGRRRRMRATPVHGATLTSQVGGCETQEALIKAQGELLAKQARQLDELAARLDAAVRELAGLRGDS